MLFEKPINKDVKVTTDEWKGYRPTPKDYDIEQVSSLHGLNFKALYTMIHQVKTWLRINFSWISQGISTGILMSSATELIAH